MPLLLPTRLSYLTTMMNALRRHQIISQLVHGLKHQDRIMEILKEPDGHIKHAHKNSF